MDKQLRLLELLKRLRDPRMPKHGGYAYNGRGVGMGRLLLGQTAYAQKRNGKVVVTNGAY